jgi:hypothetical protein
MRKSPLWLLVALALACELNSTEPETRESANTLDLRGEWQAVLAPIATSQVTASLQVREYRAYYDAALSMTGGLPNNTYNWRIFPGSCANPGATVFGSSVQAFVPLVTDGSGAANLTRLMAGAFDSTAMCNIRIMTGTAVNTTVSCGELQRS